MVPPVIQPVWLNRNLITITGHRQTLGRNKALNTHLCPRQSHHQRAIPIPMPSMQSNHGQRPVRGVQVGTSARRRQLIRSRNYLLGMDHSNDCCDTPNHSDTDSLGLSFRKWQVGLGVRVSLLVSVNRHYRDRIFVQQHLRIREFCVKSNTEGNWTYHSSSGFIICCRLPHFAGNNDHQ